MKTQTIDADGVKKVQPVQHFVRRFKLDIFVILAVAGLLFYGASWQIFKNNTDAAKYDCYAVAFWQGVPALKSFSNVQCGFITHPAIASISQHDILAFMQRIHAPEPMLQFVAHQSTALPLEALPHEYPLLTIIPFSLAMIAAPYWYQIAFALWMALLVAVIYVVLRTMRSRRTALVFALYIVLGGWATTEGRFDLVPAALTLFAVMCADRLRWNRAFMLLALATLYKFYPVLLLIPFCIGLQKQLRGPWYAWRRWEPLAAFCGVCLAIGVISLALNVEGTLGPLSYFQNRPIQVESFASSLVWLLRFVHPAFGPLHFAYSYGSLNVISPLTPLISNLDTVLLVLGLICSGWLQWRGRLTLAAASLAVLLLILITGKVFSPQYLIWVIPLAAYVGGDDRRWLFSWSILGLLTTCIYPFIYISYRLMQVPFSPQFYPFVTIRNIGLFAFTLWLLFARSSQQKAIHAPLDHPAVHDKDQAHDRQQGGEEQQQRFVQAGIANAQDGQRDKAGEHLQDEALVRDEGVGLPDA